MKKAMILLAIILTSGVAALAFTIGKNTPVIDSTSQNEVVKIQSQGVDSRANLGNAD